jgi:predicted DNA-binding protein
MLYMIKHQELPKRQYCDGEKKMVSLRLPIKLTQEIEKLASGHGWTATDIITTALDEYIQSSKKQKSKK